MSDNMIMNENAYETILKINEIDFKNKSILIIGSLNGLLRQIVKNTKHSTASPRHSQKKLDFKSA